MDRSGKENRRTCRSGGRRAIGPSAMGDQCTCPLLNQSFGAEAVYIRALDSTAGAAPIVCSLVVVQAGYMSSLDKELLGKESCCKESCRGTIQHVGSMRPSARDVGSHHKS